VNDQERAVIADIFRRLEQVANEPRDPEAERFIAERLRQQPYAAYAMAQTIFIQEQALTNLQAEAEQLRAEIEEARRQPQASGGILSSLFGGASRPAQQETFRSGVSETPRRASPWGGPSTPQRMPAYGGAPETQSAPGPWSGAMGQSRGGGFLQGALSTAAGVAGGMMVANALSSAFGGKHGASEAAAGDKTALADTGAGENVSDDASITNSLYDTPDAQQHDASLDDFEGDGGDEGDWA
jgi:hypothetical protein